MNIAICEDLSADANLLQRYIKQYFAQIHADCEIYKYNTGAGFLAEFSKGHFQIVFMDIYMDGQNADGMETARKIHEIDDACKIIFTTTSREFGVDSHEVDAVHYIVKSVTFESVKTALGRCRDIIAEEMRFITVTSNRSDVRILLKDILYIETLERKTLIHTINNTITSSLMLINIEKQLDSTFFLRCHKCYVVNMDNISCIQNDGFLMKNGDTVMIRKRDANAIKSRYTQYYFEKTRGDDL